MKDYFIRLIFGVVTFAIISVIAFVFDIDWLKVGNTNSNLIILLIMLAGMWIGWYFYKGKKK